MKTSGQRRSFSRSRLNRIVPSSNAAETCRKDGPASAILFSRSVVTIPYFEVFLARVESAVSTFGE